MANVEKIDSIVDSKVTTEISTLKEGLSGLNTTMITVLESTAKMYAEIGKIDAIKQVVTANNQYAESTKKLKEVEAQFLSQSEKLRIAEEKLANQRQKPSTTQLTAYERELNAQRNASEKQAAKLAIAEKNLDDTLKIQAKTKGEATRQNAILTQASKGVNVTTEEGIRKIKEINTVIDKNNAMINANSDGLTRQKNNVGNYTQSIKDASLQLKNSVSPAGLAANGISGVGSSLKGLATASTGFIGVGLIAAFGAIKGAISSFKDEIDKAINKESSIARLNNTLKNMGRVSWAKDLNNTLNDLKSNFNYLSSIDLRSASQKLIAYGKLSKEQFNQLLPVIVDFAANQRISLDEATTTVIRGLEGQGRAFKTYGLNIKAGGSSIENYNEIVNVLGNKVANSAKIMQDSAEGQMLTYDRKISEIKTNIGMKLLPTIVEGSKVMLSFASAMAAIPFKAVAAVIGSLLGAFLLYQASLLRTNVLLQINTTGTLLNIVAVKTKSAATKIAAASEIAYATVIGLVTGQISLATAATMAWNAVLAINPIYWIVAGVAALVGGIIALVKVIGNATGSSKENTAEMKRNTDETKRNEEALKKKKEAAELAARIDSASTQIYTKQYVVIEKLVKAVSDKTKTHKEQIEALKELIKLDPQYLGGLTQQNILTAKGISIINMYKNALKTKAEAEAYSNLISQKYNEKIPKEIELQKERNKIIELSTQKFQAQTLAGTSLGKNSEKDIAKINSQMVQSSQKIVKLTNDIKTADGQIESLAKKTPKTNVSFNESTSKTDTSGEKAAQKEAETSAKKSADFIKKIREIANNEAVVSQVNQMDKELAQNTAKYNKEKETLKNEGKYKIKLTTDQENERISVLNTINENEQKEKERITKEHTQKIAEIDLNNSLEGTKKNSEAQMNARIALLEIQRSRELAEAEKTGASKELINAKYNQKEDDATDAYWKEYVNKMAEGYDKEAAIRAKNMNTELLDLAKSYAKGKMGKEEYEKKKTDIVEQYSQEELKIYLDLAKKEAALLSGDDKKTKLKEIAKIENDIAKNNLKNTEEQKKKDDELTAKRKENLETWLNESKDGIGAITGFVNALYEGEINKIEEDQKAYDDAAQAKIDKIEEQESKGVISAETATARKKAITDAQTKYDAEADKKKTALKKKQAIMDKVAAIAQASINTAIGITNALSKVGTIPLVPYIAAMGAIEIATIVATPLAYKKGTPKGGHKGGDAVVGDGGKSEMLITSEGIFKTPSKPTFIPNLEEGAVVLPDYNEATKLLLNSSLYHGSAVSPIYDDRNVTNKMDVMTNEIKGLRGDLKKTKGRNISSDLQFIDYKNRILH